MWLIRILFPAYISRELACVVDQDPILCLHIQRAGLYMRMIRILFLTYTSRELSCVVDQDPIPYLLIQRAGLFGLSEFYSLPTYPESWPVWSIRILFSAYMSRELVCVIDQDPILCLHVRRAILCDWSGSYSPPTYQENWPVWSIRILISAYMSRELAYVIDCRVIHLWALNVNKMHKK